MKVKSEIVDGKKRIIITRSCSGVDKTRDAVIKVMGPGYKYEESNEKNK